MSLSRHPYFQPMSAYERRLGAAVCFIAGLGGLWLGVYCMLHPERA
ncbi:MAG: hypothetical protein ABI647_23610 [Gemmatimonadota bacterium]